MAPTSRQATALSYLSARVVSFLGSWLPLLPTVVHYPGKVVFLNINPPPSLLATLHWLLTAPGVESNSFPSLVKATDVAVALPNPNPTPTPPPSPPHPRQPCCSFCQEDSVPGSAQLAPHPLTQMSPPRWDSLNTPRKAPRTPLPNQPVHVDCRGVDQGDGGGGDNSAMRI